MGAPEPTDELHTPMVWSDDCVRHDPGAEIWLGVRTPGTEVASRATTIRSAVLAAGAPVVPVAHNAGLYWPKNSFLKCPGTITMRIGPAIPTVGRDPAEVIAETERWIEKQQSELCPARSN